MKDRKQYLKEWQDGNRGKCRAKWRAYTHRKKAAMTTEEALAAKAKKQAYDMAYREKNHERRKAQKSTQEYKVKHLAREKQRYAAYRAANPLPPRATPEEKRARRLKYAAEYRQANPDTGKKYYVSNRQRLLQQKREYYIKNKPSIMAAHRSYVMVRRRTDPVFRIIERCYSRISSLLRGSKSIKTMQLIGCTREQLMSALESQFQPGMTWANYGRGGWHVDHKKPCASFDLTDPEQQKLCFHYTNLQPMWAKDNFTKGSLHEGKRWYRRNRQESTGVNTGGLAPHKDRP